MFKIKSKWIGCTDHTLELSLKRVFKEDEAIKACRDVATFYNKSVIATEQLQDSQTNAGRTNPLRVHPDVTTRWWSTFTLVSRLVELKRYLNALHSLKGYKTLTNAQWSFVTQLIHVLEPFQRAQIWFESSTQVTCSRIPSVIAGLRKHLVKLSSKRGKKLKSLTLQNEF